MVDLSAAADESGRLLEQFVLGLVGNTEEQSAEKLADFLAAMPLEVLARLAAIQDHAVVPEHGTGESWSAGKAEFAKWVARWRDAKTSEAMFAIEDVAVLEIEHAMIEAGRVKP